MSEPIQICPTCLGGGYHLISRTQPVVDVLQGMLVEDEIWLGDERILCRTCGGAGFVTTEPSHGFTQTPL